MDWEQFQIWYNYLLNIEYKDILINNAISEFSRVLTDHKNGFSDFTETKQKIKKYDWKLYGRINGILNVIKNKLKINLELPRQIRGKLQKFSRKFDVQTGMMYNIPASLNGIDTEEKEYFYVPIHKTRRHIHGVPKEFLESYVYNMIETAEWEKFSSSYYTDSTKINECAIYKCPENYCIKNKEKKEKNKQNVLTKEKKIVCGVKINVLEKIINLKKFFNSDVYEKIYKFFIKKLSDNFRTNFPSKKRYITYCVGSCVHSSGLIHNGIPNGEQKCNKCKITYCRECGKSPFHTGKLCNFTCEISFENPENYRKCPGCSIWIEKAVGCDHMECLCGVHFCYNCRGVLCANDPYFHVCKMSDPDPHYRDFQLNHHSTHYEGEVACCCKSCI
jgi:hypothetical protein